MLARCAKDNYFPMVDVLFRQQANWVGVANTKDALLQISKLAGFTQESFEACLTDQKLLDDVRSVQKRGANEFKVDSTPTFFINGKTYKGRCRLRKCRPSSTLCSDARAAPKRQRLSMRGLLLCRGHSQNRATFLRNPPIGRRE